MHQINQKKSDSIIGRHVLCSTLDLYRMVRKPMQRRTIRIDRKKEASRKACRGKDF